MTEVIAHAEGVRIPGVTFEVSLEPGTYFVHVEATNESGYTQDSFDFYSDDDEIEGKVYGCTCFVVDEDGTFSAYMKEQV